MDFGKTYQTLQSMTKPSTMLEYGLHVVRWNRVAFIARGMKSTPIELQHSFIVEEFKELVEALETDNRVEVVDAACDLFVVASYAYYLYVGRSPKYDSAMHRPTPGSFSFGDLSFAIHGMPLSEDSTREILEQVVALCYRLDINLDYNMNQVLHSNDTKYPYRRKIEKLYQGTSSVEALRQECKAIEERSNGRYTGVSYREVEDTPTPDISGPRIVFFDSKGKIMKPSTFEEPKIIV